MTDKASEAICIKGLRDRLSTNFKALMEKLKKDEVRPAVLKASMYRTLNEQHFKSESALIFAQLHAELPYLDASHLNGKFSILINCDYQWRYKGFVEHSLWHVTQTMA